MKKYVSKPIAILAFSLMVINSSNASWNSAYGRVTFVGTAAEHVENGYHAQFRVRLSDSTCAGAENDPNPKERWIVVRSGRMDGIYQHNMANFRNAYTTIMTAFMSGRSIQVDGVSSCDPSKGGLINLWGSNIGIY